MKTFSLVKGGTVTILASAVVCFYADPIREEVVTKLTVKRVLRVVETASWRNGSGTRRF